MNYQEEYIKATKTIDKLTSENVDLNATIIDMKDFIEQENIKRSDFIDKLQSQVSELTNQLQSLIKQI